MDDNVVVMRPRANSPFLRRVGAARQRSPTSAAVFASHISSAATPRPGLIGERPLPGRWGGQHEEKAPSRAPSRIPTSPG